MRTPFYKEYLSNELARRCERNPRYSVRAFARALDINDGALSQILSGKRVPAYRTAQRIMRALMLSPDEEQNFLGSLAERHRSRGLQRMNPIFRELRLAQKTQEVSADYFRVMADWYHMAILEIALTDDFQSDPNWIARELGINVMEAKLAIERLLNLGLLKQQDGRLIRTDEPVVNDRQPVSTPALRKINKQLLEKSIQSMENDPVETRKVTNWTIAIDPEKLPEAGRLVDEFCKSLCQFLESGSRKQVYQLGVVLFPLQNGSAPKAKAESLEEVSSAEEGDAQ